MNFSPRALLAVSAPVGHILLIEALVHIQRVGREQPLLQLLIGILRRPTLHDVEDQMVGVLVEAGQNVAVI